MFVFIGVVPTAGGREADEALKTQSKKRVKRGKMCQLYFNSSVQMRDVRSDPLVSGSQFLQILNGAHELSLHPQRHQMTSAVMSGCAG